MKPNAPDEIQDFAYTGEMYNVETEKGDLLVSPEHKVYAKVENKSVCLSSSDISLVDLPKPILNNNLSYVHNLMRFIRQSAIKSSSFSCLPNNSLALGRNSLYSSNGTKLMMPNIKDANSLNPSSESFDFFKISSLLLRNSTLSFSGAKIVKSISNIKLNISPCEINILNRTLESITTSTHINPSSFNCLCIDSLTFSDNASASASVNLDLDTIFLNLSNATALLISSNTAALVASDQLTHDKDFMSALTSAGIANVTVAIYISPLATISSNFFNCLTLRMINSLITSDHFTCGNASILFFKSSGMDNVTVAIFAMLVPPTNYVNAQEYVYIYKPFYSKNISEYKLINVKEAQELMEKSSKVSFLNENLIRARDNAVRKENYEGAFSNNASSQITWANVPIVNNTLFDRFNYSTGKDRNDIHIHIQVPNDEPAGSKNSILTLTGWYAL